MSDRSTVNVSALSGLLAAVVTRYQGEQNLSDREMADKLGISLQAYRRRLKKGEATQLRRSVIANITELI